MQQLVFYAIVFGMIAVTLATRPRTPR